MKRMGEGIRSVREVVLRRDWRRAALFPGFEKDGENNQQRCGGVSEDDGRGLEDDALREPKKDAGEIEEQHAVGEIAASLLPDFVEPRDEGEGGAETSAGAEDFDGLRDEHLVEVSWFYSSRRRRD